MNTNENNLKSAPNFGEQADKKTRSSGWCKKKITVAIVAGACLIGAAAVLLRKAEPANGSARPESLSDVLAGPRAVALEKVEWATPAEDRSFPGTVKAMEKTPLAFRIHGPLVEVNVKAGESVKQGQVLMQVDPRDFEDRIRVLDANLERMKAQHKKAALDFERAKTLFAEQVVPQSNFDSAQSAFDETAAAVKDIEAQLVISKHQLADTSLVAPYDGIITARRAENHEMIAVGQVVLEMHDISRLKIETDIPENEISKRKLQPGESAKIQFPSLPGREFTAVLKEWNTSADAVTRTYNVVFIMDAPQDATILPGMTALVVWDSGAAAAPVVSVPARAVIADREGRSFVWVFDPKTSQAQKRFVETGKLMNAHRVQILKGLEVGEQIVREGAGFITEGMTLRPANLDSAEIASEQNGDRQ